MAASQNASAAPPGFARRMLETAARLDDGVILRTAFFIMLAGTLCVLALDYTELATTAPDQPVFAPHVDPVLPAVERPELDPSNPAYEPQQRITTDQSVLREALSIELIPGGVLRLQGTIAPGSADAFAAEIAARGEYIETVTLDSPGGEVNEALAIGRAIRAAELATAVEAGKLCASSCPLVFAGGLTRTADPAAIIGVHQIYTSEVTPAQTAQALSDAQVTTAAITRYLNEMGVDPALWLHALETPPDRLYYLTSEELTELALVTGISGQ